jgi:hypothetical protein
MNNQTVIDTIVKYSKECIEMRFIKQHLITSLRLVKKLPFPFRVPSASVILNVDTEIQMRIDERESDIGKLLEPLFEGLDFGQNICNKHSLTIKEIRDGYVTLSGEKYVILLRPLKGHISSFDYLPGILYPISPILEKELDKMVKEEPRAIRQEILNLVINNKHKYEYIDN